MERELTEQPSRRDSGRRAIYILYLGFFLTWCAGLVMGELWPGADQPSILGLPAWFFVGCVASFAGVSVALILCARRYFS